MHRKILFGLILILLAGSSNAYVYCVTKVKEIHPNKTTGIVYFKFQDGTAIQGTENDAGIEWNLSVALSSLMADRNVKIALNDGETCGSNRYEKWSYIVALSN